VGQKQVRVAQSSRVQIVQLEVQMLLWRQWQWLARCSRRWLMLLELRRMMQEQQ
jgi:hypothetical protein